jgi:hypothetical protein
VKNLCGLAAQLRRALRYQLDHNHELKEQLRTANDQLAAAYTQIHQNPDLAGPTE